jgi:hypothetical protein
VTIAERISTATSAGRITRAAIIRIISDSSGASCTESHSKSSIVWIPRAVLAVVVTEGRIVDGRSGYKGVERAAARTRGNYNAPTAKKRVKQGQTARPPPLEKGNDRPNNWRVQQLEANLLSDRSIPALKPERHRV